MKQRKVDLESSFSNIIFRNLLFPSKRWPREIVVPGIWTLRCGNLTCRKLFKQPRSKSFRIWSWRFRMEFSIKTDVCWFSMLFLMYLLGGSCCDLLKVKPIWFPLKWLSSTENANPFDLKLNFCEFFLSLKRFFLILLLEKRSWNFHKILRSWFANARALEWEEKSGKQEKLRKI